MTEAYALCVMLYCYLMLICPQPSLTAKRRRKAVSFDLMESVMLNVNRLPNSTRLQIAAAIAEEVYALDLDDEALIHELRRYGFSQAYAEAMTFRFMTPAFEIADPRRERKTKMPAPTSHPEWVFVDNVLMKITA